MTTPSNHSPTLRTPGHQQVTLPSNSPQFTTPTFKSQEELRNLYPSSFSVLNTINETRDTNILQKYPHVNPVNSIFDYTCKKHFSNFKSLPLTTLKIKYNLGLLKLLARVIYKNCNSKHLQFEIIRPIKLEKFHVADPNFSLDQVFSSKNSTNFHMKNSSSPYASH